jgi:sugar phosphate isomerase/epimerase
MNISRREFGRYLAIAPWGLGHFRELGRLISGGKSIPVGLELYSVRNELAKDPKATVRAVAAMGYECVEFYAPYLEWTEAYAKQIRQLLDGLGVRCYSTHNDKEYFGGEKLSHARELNSILGCKYVVMASSEEGGDLDGWKRVAALLNEAEQQLRPNGLAVGYHNHQVEFRPSQGKRPIEVLASEANPSVMLQLDVGTCIEAGSDPVAWIKANPGRIRSLHCKEWSAEPGKGYSVLFGEGAVDWQAIFAAAESVGGVEYYLVEQEGSRFSELETAKRCLTAFRQAKP